MIFEKLAALLSEQFGVDVDSITMDTSFEDRGPTPWTSWR